MHVNFKQTRKFLFGGKGGVGKTTIAAASALFWSRAGKTLIVSTDPAHSLSDIFEMEIGGSETEIQPNLFALEIDPERAIGEYKERLIAQYAQELRQFDLDISSYLQAIEHNPGAYESAIFDEFARHLLRKDYETIIFDTAPTGSTLRLIFMPEYLETWIKFLLQSRKGILKLRDMLVREKDPVIEKLREMQGQFQRVAATLTSESTDIILVMNPESLAYEETVRTIKTLALYHVSVPALVINRVVGGEFPYRGYVKSQGKILEKIEGHFPGIVTIKVPFLGEEVRGVGRLDQVSEDLKKLFSSLI